MAGEKKTLLENFISLGALQVFSYVIPLISLPYLSRILGPEMFGLVFFAQAFMAYFMMITDYGFGLSATREIAINRHNNNNLSNIFSAVTVVKFILLGISFLILLLAIAFVPKIHDNWLLFVLTFFMVAGNAIYPVWFFQGMERMKYITFLNILAKTIFLVLIFIFVKHQTDYILVPILNSLGFLVSGFIGMYIALKEFKIKLYIPSYKTIWKQFKYSSEFFISRASLTLYTNTNAFCLGLIGSNLMVGYYVAAEKIYNALSGLQSPLNGALYPYVAKNRDVKLFKKVFFLYCTLNVFICTFAFIFAKEIITIFYGQEMAEAYKILRIFCAVVIIDIPNILMGFPFLGALGHTKEANSSVIIASLIHIAGLGFLILTKHLTVYSIACMVFITIAVVTGLRFYATLKYNLWNLDKEIKNN